MMKYLAFVRINIQNTIAYRGPILVWLICNILSLITIIAIWLSSSSGYLIGGYTKPELIGYYVVALFLNWLTDWFPFYWVKDEIKSGEIILSTLTKPISFFKKAFGIELGWHLVSLWIGLLASILLAFFLRQNISLNFYFSRIVLLVPVVGLSILITFSLSLCMGLLAFWFTEITAIDLIYWMGRTIFGGQGIPISFIPKTYQLLVKFLPFRYMFSFPLEIYFGKLTSTEIVYGLIGQILWFLMLVQLYKLIWRSGRKAYTAFGH